MKFFSNALLFAFIGFLFIFFACKKEQIHTNKAAPPNLSVSIENNSCAFPCEIQLKLEGILEVDSILWNLGDGTIINNNNFTIPYNYNKPDDYSVIISVFKNGENFIETLEVNIQQVRFDDKVITDLKPIGEHSIVQLPDGGFFILAEEKTNSNLVWLRMDKLGILEKGPEATGLINIQAFSLPEFNDGVLTFYAFSQVETTVSVARLEYGLSTERINVTPFNNDKIEISGDIITAFVTPEDGGRRVFHVLSRKNLSCDENILDDEPLTGGNSDMPAGSCIRGPQGPNGESELICLNNRNYITVKKRALNETYSLNLKREESVQTFTFLDSDASNFYITFGKRQMIPFIAPGVQAAFTCEGLVTDYIFANKYAKNPGIATTSQPLSGVKDITSVFSIEEGFILSGEKNSTTYLFKLNTDLTLTDEFPMPSTTLIQDVIPTSDNGFAILGEKNNNLILIKTDAAGNIN